MADEHAAPQADGSAAVNPVAPPAHRVCFKLLDDRDQPLPGMEISLKQSGTDLKTKRTDNQGRTLLDGLPAGTFQVLSISGDKMYEFVSHAAEAIPADAFGAEVAGGAIQVRIAREEAKKKPPAEKAKHTVAAGDTLESIAAKPEYGLTGWQELAQYNWGTDVKDEVSRALIECIGCSQVNADPQKSTLAPPTGETREILIPKPWTSAELGAELPPDKMHVFKLRLIKPANAIGITKLDRWFIPGVQECDISYQLEGLKESADTVVLQVYGSQYCECSDWNKGLGKYTVLADTPVFEKADGNGADERQPYPIEIEGPDPADATKKKKGGWKGQVSTAKGILGVKAAGTDRFVNVAFSPYTVHLRYYKDAGDKDARIELLPFWPQWDEDKTPLAPSGADVVETPAKITVKWSNAAKADRGVLLVTDKAGQLVYAAALPAAKLAKGAQDVDWDRKYRGDAWNSQLTQEYINDDKPYSYQVITAVRKLKRPAAAGDPDPWKIEWLVKKTDRLVRGELIICNGSGAPVFGAPLPKDKLKKSSSDNDKRDFTWDGKYSAGLTNSQGGDSAIPEDMPYRVQIQAHTGVDEPKGLAVAAMHTEVRLYVHPSTIAPKDPLYEPGAAKPSFTLGLGPLVPGDPPADGAAPRPTDWYQYKLAQCGFHPGPVTASANDHYKLALREFKRSVPKKWAGAGADYERISPIDDSENPDTQAAIENIRASDERKWFGDPIKVLGNQNDPHPTDAEVESWLPDVSKELIVWVDDRQYYTLSAAAKDENNASYQASPFDLGNPRGGMSCGDDRPVLDAVTIARPWIPLKVQMWLLGKGDGLYDEVAAPAGEEQKKAMRRAIGPLRVDWTFSELPPDVSTINTAMANYDKDFVRSRYYVAWAIEGNKAKYTRKDTGRDAFYTNCKETTVGGKKVAGIRPDSAADLKKYYQKVFGFDDGAADFSLAPWRASAVKDIESIATVVHDHLLASQVAKTDLFEPLLGASGSYYNPSRIAGDGYRVRAEMQFAKFTGENGLVYDFPNLTALAARYPTPPQAHSAALRMWRKSSFRGYTCWGAATGNFAPGFLDEFRAHYRCAHVYFVHEGGVTAHAFPITDVFDATKAGHVDRYKNIIANNTTLAPLQNKANMTLKAACIWPWADQRSFGWDDPSPQGMAAGQLDDDWLDANGQPCSVYDPTWRKFRYALLLALVKEAEKKGYFRGHLLVEFDASTAFFMERYECNNPGGAHRYWYIENATGAGGRMNGQRCPAPGCGSVPPNYTLTALAGSQQARAALGLPAVGGAMGGTWLFWRGENVNRLKVVWVHEVGHHRHLEHAANAPGAVDNAGNVVAAVAALHDSEANTKATWAGPPPLPASGVAAATRWDRRCIMSYSDAWYSELGCLCGRCLLRNRGWLVKALAFPGSGKGDP